MIAQVLFVFLQKSFPFDGDRLIFFKESLDFFFTDRIDLIVVSKIHFPETWELFKVTFLHKLDQIVVYNRVKITEVDYLQVGQIFFGMIAQLNPIDSTKIAIVESHDFKFLPVMLEKLIEIDFVFAVF